MAMVPFSWLVAFLPLSFLAGRWSTTCNSPPKPLKDVEPEVQPLLYSPPSGHGVVTVPSVFNDARGAVHNMEVGGFRFNVLVSDAGTLRSGDVHRSNQYDMLWMGSMQVTTRERGVDVNRTYTAPAFIIIPAHVPHIFRSLNKTVMAEWWDDAFEARYFKPYRSVVDAALVEADRVRLHNVMAAGAKTRGKRVKKQDRRLRVAAKAAKKAKTARKALRKAR